MSVDTARVAGIGMAAAFAAHPMDDDRLVRTSSTSALKVGNVGGQFLTHLGFSFGTYAIGRMSGSSTVAAFGGDLLRAQILSQGVVQAGKMLTTRTRPDGSNNHSLPSGHTASTFATATVIQRHFGWKAGVPAYAFGAYVAASRMGENRHYLSDVLMGAALGIAAGRTVTVDVGGAKFGLGVAPAAGGAAVTFTKR
jgi:membrane-associated phospholipid phosphatase